MECNAGQVLLREWRHRGDHRSFDPGGVLRRALDMEDRGDRGEVHRRGGEEAAVHVGGCEGDPGGDRAGEAPGAGEAVPLLLLPGGREVGDDEVARHDHGQPHAGRLLLRFPQVPRAAIVHSVC